MDDREDLTGGDLVAGVGASYVALWCSLSLFLVSRGLEITDLAEILAWTAVSMIYATPVWLVVMIFVGAPIAFWIERHTSVDATVFRRFAPYVIAGSAIDALLYFLYPLAAPISVVCALAGRLGAGWWRSRRRRASDGEIVNLA